MILSHEYRINKMRIGLIRQKKTSVSLVHRVCFFYWSIFSSKKMKIPFATFTIQSAVHQRGGGWPEGLMRRGFGLEWRDRNSLDLFPVFCKCGTKTCAYLIWRWGLGGGSRRWWMRFHNVSSKFLVGWTPTGYIRMVPEDIRTPPAIHYFVSVTWLKIA